MKKISQHLGEIIIVLACIALLISSITLFKAPIGSFLSNIIKKEVRVGQDILDNISPPSVEELQERYEFVYYSSFAKAIADVNNSTTENADATSANAVVGLYKAGETLNVILFKDANESSNINITTNVFINLNGKTLNLTTTDAQLTCGANTDVTIRGKVNGSAIAKNIDDGVISRLVVSSGSSLVLDGGTYKATGTYATINMLVSTSGDVSFTARNCAFIANNDYEFTARSKGMVRAMQLTGGTSATLTNCTFNTSSSGSDNQAILNQGLLTLTNCNIEAVSDNENCVIYAVNNQAAGNMSVNKSTIIVDKPKGCSDVCAVGIDNKGTLYFNSGRVTGLHCAVDTTAGSKTYIYGGLLESPGHGGVYFAQGSAGEAYVENAELRYCEYNGAYEQNAGGVGAFYIGGTDTVVYMDNCDISTYSNIGPALKGNEGYTGNTLYLSNSSVYNYKTNALVDIRNDENSTLYIGENVEYSGSIIGTGTVENTNVSYDR